MEGENIVTRKFKQTEIGKIPENWEIVKLRDVAVVNNLTLNDPFPYEEIEYIDISSVAQGRINETKLLQRSEAPSRAQRVVRDNDILLSTVRPNLKHYAFIKKAKPNTIASTGFAVITSKKIHPQFLYYYISTDRYTYYLSAIADMHTSAYPACNPDVIENSLMPYPPLPDQRAIAKILSDLDEKIELNRQMNRTLESIAQAIFKHWFVNNKSSDDSVFIAEFIEFNPKINIKKGKLIPYMDMKSLSSSDMVISNVGVKPFKSGSKMQNNDTIMARITPYLENGKIGFVDFLQNDQLYALGMLPI